MTSHLDVVLVAHGGGEGSAVNADVLARARRLQTRLNGAAVHAAFLRGVPPLDDVLQRASRPARIVIPLFSADGYYAGLVRAMASRYSGDTNTVITPAIGAHPVLIEAMVQQVAAHLSRHTAASNIPAAVLVVGHGTTQSTTSHSTTTRAADEIVRQLGVRTAVAFLDQTPTIEEVVPTLPRGRALLVAPYLWGGGDHATDDVPNRIRQVQHDLDTAPQALLMVAPLGALSVVDDLLVRLVYESTLTRTPWIDRPHERAAEDRPTQAVADGGRR